MDQAELDAWTLMRGPDVLGVRGLAAVLRQRDERIEKLEAENAALKSKLSAVPTIGIDWAAPGADRSVRTHICNGEYRTMSGDLTMCTVCGRQQ